MAMSPENAKKVVLACCTLHNYMRAESIGYTPPGFADSLGCNGEVLDGTWRMDGGAARGDCTNNNYTLEGSAVRERFTDYFLHAGAVDWQLAHVNRTS